MDNSQVEKKVYVFPRYGQLVASSRIRCYELFKLLPKEYDVTFLDLIGNELIERKFKRGNYPVIGIFRALLKRLKILILIPSNSIVWVEKEFLPFFPGIVELSIINLKRLKAYYDFDDDWITYYVNKNFLIRKLCANKFRVIFSNAKYIVSNERLFETFVLQGLTPIKVLRTNIHFKNLVRIVPESGIWGSKPTLGWIGTPLSALQQVGSHVDLVNQLCEKYEVWFCGIGDVMPNLKVKRIDWRIDGELDFIDSCHFGFVPMSDSPFNKNKSFLKAHMFLARGKPVFAPKGISGLSNLPGVHTFTTLNDISNVIAFYKRTPNEYSITSKSLVAQYSAAVFNDNSVEELKSLLINW